MISLNDLFHFTRNDLISALAVRHELQMSRTFFTQTEILPQCVKDYETESFGRAEGETPSGQPAGCRRYENLTFTSGPFSK